MIGTEIWRSSENAVFSSLDGSIAILDTVGSVYYTLDGIGPFLWDRVVEGCSFDDLCRSVELNYEVGRDVARKDISEWLAEMSAAGLVMKTSAA
jgi:hypothetical protein